VGGGIFSSGEVEIINSTISGNTAAQGGAFFTSAFFPQTITNTTITGNSASDTGGISSSFSTIVLNNSIVAGNIDTELTGMDSPDVKGNFNSNGRNIIGSLEGSNGLEADLVVSDITQILNPLLSDNGGSIPTHALVTGSPAIDAGDNLSIPPDIVTDQRGVGFPRIVNTLVDIGSVEQQLNSPTSVPEPSNSLPILTFGVFLILLTKLKNRQFKLTKIK